MARRTYVDTHVVIWLHDGEITKLSPRAYAAINAGPVFMSEFVRLEMQYLMEIRRLRIAPDSIVRYLQDEIGLMYCDRPLGVVITEAMGHSWTRDPFDRLITATAAINGDRLITKDKSISDHYDGALW